MKLEQRTIDHERVPIQIAEAIRFYEGELPDKVVWECREVAEGTEGYVDLLLEKYKEIFKR